MSMKRPRPINPKALYAFYTSETGYSLIEILVVAVIMSLIIPAATRLLLGQLNANKKTAAVESLRKTWAQATSFMISEAELSEKIYTSSSSFDLTCRLPCMESRPALLL